MIYVDVDGLKAINDRFGHAQGDEALRTVADAIRASIARVGRGGARRRRRVRDPGRGRAGRDPGPRRSACGAASTRANDKAGRPFRLSLSIGAVDWEPGEQVTLQELIERADQRMYDDKREKRR